MATQIDEWSIHYNWTEALDLFRLGITHEANFFNQAGNHAQSLWLKDT